MSYFIDAAKNVFFTEKNKQINIKLRYFELFK